MVQDSKFVRWSSAFHHVFVFTVKTNVSCSFISSSIPCRQKLFCAKIYFLLPARNYKAQSGLAIKIEIYNIY